MERDSERIKRLADILGDAGIDFLVVLDEANIHYLAGGVIDYSAVFLDVREGSVKGVVNRMEAERAGKVTWLDDIVVYTRDGVGVDGFESVRAENLYDAISKVVGRGVVAIPYRYVSHESARLLKKYLGSEPKDATEPLMRARVVKTRYEISKLTVSAEIVDRGIDRVVSLLREGLSEKDLMLKGKCAMMEFGAEKTLDFLIVASGPNSAYPHWRCSDRVPMEGDAVTLDFVAAYQGYYGDETRTVFLGEPSNELKKIYEVVLESQEAAVDAVAPGMKASEIHKVAWDIIDRNGYSRYFTHSTGHGIGLEVHEPPRLYKEVDVTLEPGMVVTVEPGIYIEGLGGVRIEDMVLVTENGAKVLTRLTKDLVSV